MVPVTEAVKRSRDYLADVFPSAKKADVRLEGVELSDDSRFWLVTFSYADVPDSEDIAPLGHFPEYKTVKLRAEDGEFFGARNGVSNSGLL